MTAVEALIKTATDTIQTLKNSDLIEGESLSSPEEVDAEDTIMFWHALAKNGGGRKETYITWNLLPADPAITADDNHKIRRATALIDIFTRGSIYHTTTQELLNKINTQALADGWQCEMYDVPSYDPEFQRTRLTLQLKKILS